MYIRTYVHVCSYTMMLTLNVNIYADINECTDPRSCEHHQVCFNTAGSYKCKCLTGYKPDDSYKGLISDGSYYHCNGTYVM